MKNLLLYACCLLAIAPTAIAYEVSSFSTASSPTFIETADGPANLTYPAASTNTFGSPEWYEHAESVNNTHRWKLVADGMTATNTASWDGHHVFTEWPYCTWPDRGSSEWYLEYMLDMFVDDIKYNVRFPDQDESDLFQLVSAPYEGNTVGQHDIGGMGTIELVLRYKLATTNEYVIRSATLFPAGNITVSTEGMYPSDPPVEIWLPKFQRLTPASRSALMAAYEAYFERMFWGSYGYAYGGEDWSEWSLWNLGDPYPGADFVFRSETWSTYTPDGVGILDAFDYPESAYYEPEYFPFERRRYPSGCFRLMDEATNVAKLAYSMRHLSPFFVKSGWLGHGAVPDEPLRNETPFLVRPQWLLDGRSVAGHYTADNCGSNYLWWSSQVEPPAVRQVLDPGRSGETYVPEFSGVFPVFEDPVFYAEDGMTDEYIPFKADEDLVRNVKPAQYAFTFNRLASDGMFRTSGPAPVPIVFSMLKDALVNGEPGSGSGFMGSVGRMDGYVSSNLTVIGFVTNCVRQAARSLPYRPDAMAAYSSRLADTSQTFRVDSAPVAAASHLLGLMDRTIHIPFQEFAFRLDTAHVDYWKYYYNQTDGDGTNYITYSIGNVVTNGTDYETGFLPSDVHLTPFSVSADYEWDESERTDVVGYVDPSVRMFADAPSPIPDVGDLINIGYSDENMPHKSFKVGTKFVYTSEGVEPRDGRFAVGSIPRWQYQDRTIASGPFVMCYATDGSGYSTETFVFTHANGGDPRIVISRGVDSDEFRVTRDYNYRDSSSISAVGLDPYGDPQAIGPVQCFSTGSGVEDATVQYAVLVAGAVDTTNEYGVCRTYDFLRSGTGYYDNMRETLVDMLSSDVDTMIYGTLDSLMTDVNRGGLSRAPKDPATYAPLPDHYGQSLLVKADPGPLTSLLVGDTVFWVDETYPDGTYLDIYKFDVVTKDDVSGFVDLSVETNVLTVAFYNREIYGHLTNGVFVEDFRSDDDLIWNDEYDRFGEDPSVVREDVTHVSVTSEVLRVVYNGGIRPEERTVSSNVTFTTAVTELESRTCTREVYLFVLDQSTGTYRYYTDYYEEDPDPMLIPTYLQPSTDTVSGTWTEMVDLDPSDAKYYETVEVGGTFRYFPVLTVYDGTITRIEMISNDPGAPPHEDVEEFVVADETLNTVKLVADLYEMSSVTNDAPADANWTGSFRAAARPAVMTWTDWIWNALKRD